MPDGHRMAHEGAHLDWVRLEVDQGGSQLVPVGVTSSEHDFSMPPEGVV
jgi:hypothetical protein